MINPVQKRILKLAVKAGEIMMKSGAEISRVEDTITRICKACRIPFVEIFATPTGVFVSIDPGVDDADVLTYVSRLHGAQTDLKKLSDINEFSRVFTTTDLSIEDGMKRLDEIDAQKPYPFIMRLLGAGLVAAFFCMIFAGTVLDGVFAFGIGLVSYTFSNILNRYDINYFIHGMSCCAIATILALTCALFYPETNTGPIIIGSMMLFVPGAAITISIRDFLSGDMLSGVARMTEAFVIAVSLAAGAGIVMKVWYFFSANQPTLTTDSTSLIVALLLGFGPTLGFCLLFHVPKNNILAVSIIGGLGWGSYQLFASYGSGSIMACFLGAAVVGLLSDISSRLFKQASTIFIIPGILPLVPGAGMYYTMLNLIYGNNAVAASIGSSTVFLAGAIALGLLVIGSIIRIINSIKRKVFN